MNTIDNADLAVLTKAGITLRPIASGDAPMVQRYASDARVAQMLAVVPHPYPDDGAQTFIAEVLNGETTLALWAITKADDVLIGVISINDKGDNLGEVGYWVAPDMWGQGIATAALALVTNEAKKLGYVRLNARAHQDNPASAQVIRKNGFVQGDDGESNSVFHGANVPDWRFSLVLKEGA